jgi:hypothetical protein
MSKKIIVSGLVGFLLLGAGVAFASGVTTNATTYLTPAAVTFTNTVTSTDVVYNTTSGVLVCYVSSGVTSGSLNSLCTSGGSFNAASSTIGSYALLQTSATTCGTAGYNYSTCQAQATTLSEADFQVTQGVPVLGGADVAVLGTSMLSPFVQGTEYTVETFGPPLFWILLAIAVFFAIYHRVKVGRWL